MAIEVSNIISPVTSREGSVTPSEVFNVGVLLAEIVGAEPSELLDPAIKFQEDNEIDPVVVLFPDKVKFPLPDFVIPPLPEITPDKVCAELELKVKVPLFAIAPA